MSDQTEAPARQPIINLPPVTKALVAVNVAVFAAMSFLVPGLIDQISDYFGLSPARYVSGEALSLPGLLSPITYQFLHGSWTHLGVNMMGLVAFGAGVERFVRGWRFLVFYLLCGVAGGFLECGYQLATAPVAATGALVGASAAISGLFGGLLRLGIFGPRVWTIVAVWLFLNAATGVAGVLSDGAPIAWVAHMGGFFAGMVLLPLFLDRPRPAA